MSTSREDADLNALETVLLDLVPQPALSRDAVLFAAGRASVPRRGWWPHACAGLAAVVLGLSVGMLFRPDPPPQNHRKSRFPSTAGSRGSLQ